MSSESSTEPEEPDQQDVFRLLAESIPHLAWIARPDGSVYWYNRRWYEYTGTTLQDMQGWGWQRVHRPDTIPFVLAAWTKSIQSGEPYEVTLPLRAADGTFRTFLTRAIAYKDQEGKVLRWFGTNTDVDDKLRSAAALRESEQRFRIATHAIDGVLWTNTAEGEMRGEQTAWSTFTGQTPAQYSGYGWASAVHPDDAQLTIDAWQVALRESRLFAFEHRVRRRDGAYRLCSIRALPVRNDDGSIREWVGVHTDITEDRERQQTLRDTIAALRRQEEMIEVAQIANNVGFWGYKPSDTSADMSTGTRYLMGLPPSGQIPVETAFQHIHPEDVPGIQNALATAFRTGTYNHEVRVATGEPGQHRWLLGVGRVLSSGAEEPRIVGINLDITQQKQSAHALIRTEKLAAVGRLAASLAHEINNPLEAIINLLYLLLQSPLDDEQRSYCATMMTELRHVSAIATHTLRFHRQTTNASETRLDTLIESVLTLFEGKIRNAGVIVEPRLSPAHVIHGFQGELRQVLANLIGNAIDAMHTGQPGERRLLVRTHSNRSPRTGAPGITITVADTGCGIPPAVLQHIFDPFFTTKGDLGTGLGLWVTSEIVRKHQGEIRLRSRQTPHGHGTVARLFLPHPTTPA